MSREPPPDTVLVTCGNCGNEGLAHKLNSIIALPLLWGKGSVDGSLPLILCGDCCLNPGPTIELKIRIGGRE